MRVASWRWCCKLEGVFNRGEGSSAFRDLLLPAMQRAKLASRLTRLSLSPSAMLHTTNRQLEVLAKEWCHIRALTLTPKPSLTNSCTAVLAPMAATLESLRICECSREEALGKVVPSWEKWYLPTFLLPVPISPSANRCCSLLQQQLGRCQVMAWVCLSSGCSGT